MTEANPTTDLVSRLRTAHEQWRLTDQNGPIAEQAADEIERLRNHVFNGVGLMQWYLDHYGSTDAHSHEARVWVAAKFGETA